MKDLKWKTNLMGHILRRNILPEHLTESKMERQGEEVDVST